MDSKFYLNSSVVGALRYFTRFNDNVLLDFDETTLNDQQFNLFNLINTLSDTKGNYYKEYAIRNCKAFIELAGRENVSKFSNSNQNLESDCLYAKFNPDLSLQLYERPKQLEPHQVEIQLKASGINFRDSLIYRGLVSQQSNFPQFGSDSTGVVTRVGDQVSKCKVGDRVCLLIGSFGSHYIANEDYICLIPDKVSFTEAASIPTTYVAIYRTLIKLANLFDDFEYNSSTPKSVLIHSATGGIGLSALNILKWKMKQTGMKINIFVTVSTKEKENYLEQNYGSMITGIFSSLSTEYVDGIKSKLLELGSTRGGVDAILNTFASDFMHANFSTLAQDGTIVDLSVTHLYNHEFLDFNKFRHNIGYITTDVSLYPPIYQRTALRIMLEAIANKELDLPPIKVYPVGQLNDALTFIGERKHIGKLTIDYDQDIVTPQLIKQNQNKIIKENNDINSDIKCLLITGQQGMVLEILRWILENSNTITDVIILTKSSMKWDIQRTINQHKSKVNFYFKSVDIGNSSDMHQTINQLYNENTKLPPVDSILHFAYLHTESEPLEITYDELSSVHDSKTMGLINLHEISLLCKWNIKHFIISSSALVFSPTFNQCAYISANMVYDSFSKYRRSLGLECTNLIFGVLQGAGYVSRKKSVETSLSHMGVLPTNISKILGTIDLIISNNNNKDIGTNIMISKFNFETLKRSGEKFIHIDYYMNQFESNNNTIKSQDSVRDKIISTISDLLSISASKLNYSSMKLKDYGVDSLFMVQLKNWIEKEFQKPNIISISQLQNSTIDIIIQIIQKSLKNIDTDTKKDNNVEKMKDLFIEIHDNEFWNNEIKLDNSIRPTDSCILKENSGSVLLTGATGYLGSQILVDLLKQPTCKYVYCLVRSKSREHALSRIIQTLSKYQLIGQIIQNDIENRIIPIVSYLDQPLLGLSQEEFNILSQSIDVIIHSAATVRFNVLYSHINDVGILKELLKLVSNNKERLIRFVFVSSISVLISGIKDNQSDRLDGKNIDKIPFLESINSLIGYGQSKIIQENIMVEACNRGIPSAIVRPSFIFANPMTMIPNQNDTLQIFFNSCKSLKKCPQFEESDFISTISISTLSESIIEMALLDDTYWINQNNTTIPLINLFGEPIMSKDLFESVSAHTSFPLVDFKEWLNNCLESIDPACQRLTPLIPSMNPLLFKEYLNGVKSSDKDNKQTVTTDMILKLFSHK